MVLSKMSCAICIILLCIIVNSFPSSEAINCISCASAILKSQWQVTSFPLSQAALNMTFDDKDCATITDPTGLLVECPADLCVEMLLVVAGHYAVLRGCHPTLLGSYKDELGISGGDDCYYGGTAKSVEIDGKLVNSAVEGVHFCTQERCNSNLMISTEFARGSKWSQEGSVGKGTCTRMQSRDCIHCYRYDNKGWCNANVERYCQGAWCTKTVGYLNDRYIEIRGCSNINPLNNALCVRMETDNVVALPGSSSIAQHLSAEQCMCQGSRCNGEIGTRVAIWPLMLFFAVPMLLLQLSWNCDSHMPHLI